MTEDGSDESTVIGQPTWEDVQTPPGEAERCYYCGGWLCYMDCPTRDVLIQERPRI